MRRRWPSPGSRSTLAFRAGMFNIGAEGQVVAGAVAGGYVGFAWHLPIVIHLVVAAARGDVGGAIWGGIAGVLKARTGAHEVITTIMLNYIALNVLVYLLSTARVPAARPDRRHQPVRRRQRAAAAHRGRIPSGATSVRCSRSSRRSRWRGCSVAARWASDFERSAPTPPRPAPLA